MKFSHGLLALALAGGLNISVALASGVAPTPMALDGTTILPDPSLANGHILPASAATAGVARVSAAADGPLQNCSRHNPCAMPTPSRDAVAVTAARHANEHDAQAARPHAPGGKPDLRS